MADGSSTITRARAIAKQNRWPGKYVKTEADAQAVLDGGCYFDPRAAERVIEFFSTFLRHSKGAFAGEPFTLLPWEAERLIAPLFGWKRSDGTRRFRRGGVWIPKKNGKTTIFSGISLYLVVGDNESGAEVYSGANDRDQASMVYREAAAMVRQSPELASVLEPIDSRRTITYHATNSFYRALSADVPTKEGLNASAVLIDELHALKDRKLWSTLAYAGAARRQPLLLSISTAGIYDPASIGWEQYQYAKHVLDGTREDWSFFALVYEADPAADWTQPKVWKAANPSYGVTVQPDQFAEHAAEAKDSPEKQNDFLRYRLNIWVQQAQRAIDLRVWDENHRHPIAEKDTARRNWFGGLDLGGTADLSAWIMIAGCDEDPDAIDVRVRFWLPEATLTGKHPNAVLYRQWAEQGWLTVTPGNVADEHFIQAQIVKDAEQYHLVGGNIDRLFQGLRLTLELADQGVTLAPMGQGFLSVAAPTKKLLELILARKVHHGAHPILRWQADNVVLRKDPAGNVKIDKERSPQKVDGFVALMMAIDAWSRHVNTVPEYQMLFFGPKQPHA